MRRHPRAKLCHDAQTDLHKSIAAWLEKWDLTTVEELAILNHTLSGTIGGTLKYALREERHGDDQTPADQDQGEGDGGRRRGN